MIIYYSGGRKAAGDGEPENVLRERANVMLAFGYHGDMNRLDVRATMILGEDEDAHLLQRI